MYFTNYFYFHDGIIEIYKSDFEKVSEWDTTIQDTMEEYDNDHYEAMDIALSSTMKVLKNK